MTSYLESITLRFPAASIGFTDDLASLIDVLGHTVGHHLCLTSSNPSFYPQIRLDFRSESADILVDFTFSSGDVDSVKVENTTGLSKASPYSYTPLSVDEVHRRLVTSGISLVGLDHAGFNLPWFSPGVHPRILQLRQKLSSLCLYHAYPTGEPWDFILPGDIDEIATRKTVDYSKVRRPKFELVSFGNASTPLIQFDIGVNVGYDKFLSLFPESLNDPEFRNIWIYLETPYAVDVCLVLNEFNESDWSDYFKGFRL